MNNCQARSRNCQTDYSLRSCINGLAVCVTAMTVPYHDRFWEITVICLRPSFLLVSRDLAIVPRASSHPYEINTGWFAYTPTFSNRARIGSTSVAASHAARQLRPRRATTCFRRLLLQLLVIHLSACTYCKSIFCILLIT